MKTVQQQLDELDIIYGKEPKTKEKDSFALLQDKQAMMYRFVPGLFNGVIQRIHNLMDSGQRVLPRIGSSRK